MQATAAVVKMIPQTPSGAGSVSSVASDAAATEGVDFAALLAAQFTGKDGVALPVVSSEAEVDAEALLKSKVASDVQLAVDSVPALAPAVVDPALQALALMPGIAPALPTMQHVAPEIKPTGIKSALSFDQFRPDRNVSELSDLAEALLAQAKDKTVKEGSADFAVSGKPLPSGDLKAAGAKLADTFKLPAPPLEAARLPDASSVVPTMMSANQSHVVSEVKIPAGNLQPPVGTSGWGDALGQKVVWMAGQHQQVAELHLNPPNLGPMEVRLTISNDQVSALFVAHQPAVREALEAAMPRLREMFADSGMTLGNAMVSSDSLPQQQNSGQEKQSGAGSQSRYEFPMVDGYSMPVTSHGIMPLSGDGRGMVDLFA